MTDQFGVRHTELTTHAGHVEAVADRVTTAQQAGAAVRAGADAYGKLCAIVPVALGVLQDILVDGIGAAAESLHDTGARLRATAAGYDGSDQRSAEALHRVKERM
ncbi:excreted virulence factor EspC (type VII ESX diderm) [Krasilnikovia cinnamomea]|uniref:Excreted virulence factor EspC (Type VII ESX diderm) n=1 Tax=Krasilnikovia cinnamomea TaxID=349313 RepID=A0A4V2G7E7_9ACTN|nr:type VII secretion target [Krasilnikovia cinnamomea]RZU52266.1 excreted virulence factor EspC (type VII ESX diderm) [Krasilnikovia cinnamomea]